MALALLTAGIYTGLITGISTVTMGTCRLITSIYNHENPDVRRYFKQIDLERKLKLVEAVIKKIPQKKDQQVKITGTMQDTIVFDVVSGEATIMSDPIELSLYYLQEIMVEIQKVVQKIHDKADRHKNKWFNTWRTLNIKDLSSELENDIKILDDRYNDLLQIINLYQKSNR